MEMRTKHLQEILFFLFRSLRGNYTYEKRVQVLCKLLTARRCVTCITQGKTHECKLARISTVKTSSYKDWLQLTLSHSSTCTGKMMQRLIIQLIGKTPARGELHFERSTVPAHDC